MTPFDIAWSLLKQIPWSKQNPLVFLTGQNAKCPKCGQNDLVKYTNTNTLYCGNCGYDSQKEEEAKLPQNPLQNNPFWIGNTEGAA